MESLTVKGEFKKMPKRMNILISKLYGYCWRGHNRLKNVRHLRGTWDNSTVEGNTDLVSGKKKQEERIKRESNT